MKLTNFQRSLCFLLLAVGGLCLTACAGLAPTPTQIPTQASTDTPTATIVWFPPTDTPTAFPTEAASPTAESLPGLGSLVFSDSFSDPTFWNTTSSSLASAVVERNQLILSVSSAGVSIASLRSLPSLDDFYAEVTVDLSLCRTKDQYGVLFRAAPGGNFYSFEVNCNGQVRLERSRNAATTLLQDWLISGDAPLGGPAEVKLGVWAAGNEMRLFLNDNLQFSARDRYFKTGTLGFFVASNGTTPVLATFSDLAVYSVSYVPPPPTPLPTRTPHK